MNRVKRLIAAFVVFLPLVLGGGEMPISPGLSPRTRSFLVAPAQAYYVDGGQENNFVPEVGKGLNISGEYVHYTFSAFSVPLDFSADMTVRAICVTNATGDIVVTNTAFYRATDAVFDEYVDSFWDTVTLPSFGAEAIEVGEFTMQDAAPGQSVNLYFSRDGTDVGDTLNGNLYFVGWLIEYTAEH